MASTLGDLITLTLLGMLSTVFSKFMGTTLTGLVRQARSYSSYFTRDYSIVTRLPCARVRGLLQLPPRAAQRIREGAPRHRMESALPCHGHLIVRVVIYSDGTSSLLTT